MTPLWISSFTATSCIGSGLAATRDALIAESSGLGHCAFETARIDTYVGEVPGVDRVRLPAELAAFECRNNRLAELGLRQDGFIEAVQRSVRRHGARRIGVFLGTSTSGILQTELAYRERDLVTGALPDSFRYDTTHNSFSVADYVRRRLGLLGPAVVVSCACASSAKVFGSARRMLEAGLIDAAVVGGVDSLCLTTLYGFHSLQLSSPEPCRPFDVARNGISIGEAAAFALLERTAPDANVAGAGSDEDAILLLGIGESSDAYHMSAPHPQGDGARRAMQAALHSAGLEADAIDYVNLHGTATPSNDRSEGRAVRELFSPRVRCSSTKGATGHTLGAAGALEAVICALALRNDLIPGSVHTRTLDPEFDVNYVLTRHESRLERVLSNSFGFGGTNCSLIIGRGG